MIYQVEVKLNRTIWRFNGKLHRTDGPAIEFTNGDQTWHKHGKLHRTDGPAATYSNGTKYWYKHGKLHRTDGPAIEFYNGDKYWYLNGQQLTEEEFNNPVCPCPVIIEIDGRKYRLEEV